MDVVSLSTIAENRLRDLRRMRLFATALLALMTAIFIATYVTTLQWIWLAYLRAFAEAGMIGACADWFAVVALFRHPLGLPIPHTAIVPHNKERIGGAIGRFISNNFLSPKVLTAKIREIDPVGWAAHWLLGYRQRQPCRATRGDVVAADPAGDAARRTQRFPGARRAKRHRSGSGGAAGIEGTFGALGPGRDPGAGRAGARPCGRKPSRTTGTGSR